MSRPQVFVRRVDESHQRRLTELWLTGRREAGMSGEVAQRFAGEGVLGALLQRPDVVVLAASSPSPTGDDGDELVGYVVLVDSVGGLLADAPCTTIEQLYIAPDWRRHGVARQLLSSAAAHADRVGSLSVVSNVPSQAREANRFFARLGFSPTVVRRVTTPAALHRKLAAASEAAVPAPAAGAYSGVYSGVYSRATAGFEILHRRRTARVRAVREGGTI